MKQLWFNFKAWMSMYLPVQPPEEPKERLTLEEALELFQGEQEAEWEEDV